MHKKTILAGLLCAYVGMTAAQETVPSYFADQIGAAGAAVIDVIPPSDGSVPEGYDAPKDPEVARGLKEGIKNFDAGLRKVPALGVEIGKAVAKEGIAGMLYNNPEVKAAGKAVGQELGAGVRNISQAVAKDLVDPEQ